MFPKIWEITKTTEEMHLGKVKQVSLIPYLDDYIYILSFQAKTTTVTEIKASTRIYSQAASQSRVHTAQHDITNFQISAFTFFLKA